MDKGYPGDRARRLCILLSCSFISLSPESYAGGFFEDSALTGDIYYWQRERDRKEPGQGHYQTNLSHGTWNGQLDFSSGTVAGIFSADIAAFTAIEMLESSASAHPNEIAFSSSDRAYSEAWAGDKSGISLYKAFATLQYRPFTLHAGYLQPQGQSLLAPHWSLLPGTYRGAEVLFSPQNTGAGNLKLSYMWTDRYKAPWHLKMDRFYKNDRNSRIAYLHSLGAEYDFSNGLVVESAMGQAKDYLNQYMAKTRYTVDLAGSPLTASYQFYGAKHQHSQDAANPLYQGMAWLQAITLAYRCGPVSWRVEATQVSAAGRQGYFLQRMTPTYASSNGRLDIWWDNRSDFNAHGEKAVFISGMYDLAHLKLPGLTVGASFVYGWDARPSSVNDSPDHWYRAGNRLRESAWSLKGMYTVQEGRAKGTFFKLHFTRYHNHSDIPTGAGGYGNIFQDEKDIKFLMGVPFTLK